MPLACISNLIQSTAALLAPLTTAMLSSGMKHLNPAWRCALGGFLIHMVLGTLYLWGNITPAVTSYLRTFDDSLNYNKTLLVYITSLGMNGVSMCFGGYVVEKLGARGSVALGGYIIVLGSLLSSFATSLAWLVLTQGGIFGLGFGIAYTGPITAASKWLPEKKGLLNGLIIGGMGVGSLIFSAVANAYVNPNHQSVDDNGYFSEDSTVVERVPNMFRVLAGCYFAATTLSIFFIKPFRDVLHDTTDCSNPKAAASRCGYDILDVDTADIEMIAPDRCLHGISLEDGACVHKPKYSTFELLFLPLAWLTAACFVFTAVGGLYLAGTFKTFGEKHFSDERFLTIIGAIASGLNSAGRIFWGYVGDRCGFARTLCGMNLFFALIIYTYPFSVLLGRGGYVLWTFLIFFCEGGNFALYLPLTIQLFGSKHAGSNYGLFFAVFSVFVVLDIALITTTNISFILATTVLGCVNLIGAVLLSYLQNKTVYHQLS